MEIQWKAVAESTLESVSAREGVAAKSLLLNLDGEIREAVRRCLE